METSVLVIGAGIAGLYTALKLAPLRVTVITARPLGRGGSSVWAQGGMAAAIGEDDHPDFHLADTINAGAGLVDETAARLLVDGGDEAVLDLVRLGVPFDRDEAGQIRVGREAAHGCARIVHATGDKAGAAIMDALINATRAAPHITVRERVIVEDLLTDDDGRVCGVLAYVVESEERVHLQAVHTVFATGGLGGLYGVTTNPVRAQGHGLAFAFRAGAVVRDPEFVQFHPTALNVGVDPAPLATEAIRGDGAVLVDERGERFMPALHPDAELAPRDVVARGVEAALKAGNGAFIDARDAIGARFPDLYPTVFASCMANEIDPRLDLIPIAPAAHYHMGGIMTDLEGRSTVPGLWAVGEVASTGVHGANRLASNSLLEAIVFGARTAEAIRSYDQGLAFTPHAPEDRLSLPSKPADPLILKELRLAMARGAALIRSRDSLKATRMVLEQIGEDSQENETLTSGLLSTLITARLIVDSAIMREESRGAHFREDFPQTDDEPAHTEINL